MIARLAGVLVERGGDHAVIDVHGVGWLVQLSARTLDAIGAEGGAVTLLTELQVREDAMTLYGFGSAAERQAFRLLTGVQGVGGRVALAILSVLAPADLARAIASADKAMVARANGVGPKLAQRIVMELKDKFGGLEGVSTSGASGHEGSGASANGAAAEALSALAHLGFRPAEASAAVAAAEAELGAGAGLDAIVRLALRKAAK